ncbi:DegT/DnrJ/EryC1/StrS family aminotransferase [Pseudonocardia sp. T1-2H]|uniref:DegT/DnrJ/EryC1/StrS family aminotransferase n=1 Tax=Pseudonocardia sp. T1-2H TaxID=3128899 RepID=UPI0031013FD9
MTETEIPPAETPLTETARRAGFLPFALPTVEEEDIEEVVGVLRSGWLTSGPEIKAFEQELGAEVTPASALAVSSGTAAMHLALTSLGVTPGRSVITTPLTFCSTAHVIEQSGCRPVFVDVEPGTLNLDPVAVRAALEHGRHDVAAILPVHYGGHPCELDEILGIAAVHGLPVVEDAAHAFGAAFRGTPIGAVPGEDEHRAVCFSLYATKNITSGEGGVLTGARPVVDTARLWSQHGMSRDSWQRYGPRGSWDYEVVVPGFKYNMSDLQAALARTQLRRWRALQERRTAIARRYTELFDGLDEVQVPECRPHVTHAWHLFPVRLRLPQLTIGRAEFIDELRRLGIGTSVHFIPLHQQPYYRDRYGHGSGDLPVASAEFERLISLPIYPRMSAADVEDVAAAVRQVVAAHRRRS